MRGTADKPQVDFAGAARRLAALLLRQQAISKASEGGGERKPPSGSGGGSSGFLALGKVVGEAMFKVLVLPSKEAIEATEAQMAEDMSKVPQRWSSG
jgi:hypothetical protein